MEAELTRESRKQGTDGAALEMPVELPPSGCTTKIRSCSAKESSDDRYASIISAQPKEALVEFLVSLCLEYDEIGSRVSFEFGVGNTEDQCKSCIELIRSSIRQHSERHGFVEYRDAYGAAEGARMVLQRAEDAAGSENYASAAAFYLCVLHEMIPLLQSADDSDGYIGGTIDEALEGLGTIAGNDLSDNTGTQLFIMLLKESASQIYEDWFDWRLSLLEKCSILATTSIQRRMLEQQLNALAENPGDGSWSSRYLEEQLAQIQ